MKTCLARSFQKSFKRLQKSGGSSQIAYQQVITALEMWKHGDGSYLTRTHNGERRIANCVKYDLPSAYRLVTVENGIRFVLYVGSHDDVDQWLDNNVGLVPTVNSKGKVTCISVTEEKETALSNKDTPTPGLDLLTDSVFHAIPAEAVSYLGLPKPVITILDAISAQRLSEDEKIWGSILELPYASLEQAFATYDVLQHVAKSKIPDAITRAELFAEKATTSMTSVSQAIEDGTSTDEICDLDNIETEELKQILSSNNFAEWLLYLTPEQNKYVKSSYSGHSRLIGVSGSGKTCVAVHRAKELAIRYPNERILFLVLNESLKTLVNRLLDELCTPEIRRNVEVKRIYEYCHAVVEQLSDASKTRLFDDKTAETVEVCWDQFTRKPQRKKHDRIRKDLQHKKLDPWGYLHDEFTWIRSGFGKSKKERDDYFDAARQGRGQSINFPKVDRSVNSIIRKLGSPKLSTTGFYSNARHQVLEMLREYEEYMAAGHLLDEDGIALEAYTLRDRIDECPDLRARCVIVDECQDCSTVQLAVIQKIPTAKTDSLFLVGDPAQKVFPKQQNLKNAGIDIRGRGSKFRQNYRNTREILEAAFPIVQQQSDVQSINDLEILPPEYANRTGPVPTLITCDSSEEQKQVLQNLTSTLGVIPEQAMCIGIPGPVKRLTRNDYVIKDRAYRLLSKTNAMEMAKEMMPDAMEPIDICDFGKSIAKLDGRITVAQFDEMKGFEFSTVILTNLDDENLFPSWIPNDEHWRVAFQTYVAMTRARDNLWLLTSSPNARIFDLCGDSISHVTGEEFLSGVNQHMLAQS